MASEESELLKFEGLRFLDSDREVLLNAGFFVCYLHGWNFNDLKREGLGLKIGDDLRNELLVDRYQNRSHFNEVAFNPNALFLPYSNMRPLKEQDDLARIFVEAEIRRLGLKGVGGGISRFGDYAEVILEYQRQTGVRLLERGKYPYLSVRTRTRVFGDRLLGVQSSVAGAGPYDADALNVNVDRRDEGDGDIGVMVLLYPVHIPIVSEKKNP